MYDMTPYLIDGVNVLSVKVDHSRYADSRWYTGSGIYRDVWLVAAENSHIAQWGVGYNVSGLDSRRASMEVDVAVENPGKNAELILDLFDASGKRVVSKTVKNVSEKNTAVLSVGKPHRWDLDNPYLYALKVSLRGKWQDHRQFDNSCRFPHRRFLCRQGLCAQRQADEGEGRVSSP